MLEELLQQTQNLVELAQQGTQYIASAGIGGLLVGCYRCGFAGCGHDKANWWNNQEEGNPNQQAMGQIPEPSTRQEYEKAKEELPTWMHSQIRKPLSVSIEDGQQRQENERKYASGEGQYKVGVYNEGEGGFGLRVDTSHSSPHLNTDVVDPMSEVKSSMARQIGKDIHKKKL